LWIIYTNGSSDGCEYILSPDEKNAFIVSIGIFKGLIESWTNDSVVIINDIKEVTRAVDVTNVRNKYISRAVAEPDISEFSKNNRYNWVITISKIGTYLGWSHTDGNWGILPFEPGYAAISQGSRPWWKDLNTDAANAHAGVALHEFLHGLEGSFRHLGFFMPPTHLYTNMEENKPYDIGFEKNYDNKGRGISFFKDYFRAGIKYIEQDTGITRYLGFFPSMWKYLVEAQANAAF
jgi:hypothetical protein